VPLGFLPETIRPFRNSPNEPYSSAPGLPFGIVLMGGAWSERTLIGCAYALEQKVKIRPQRKAFAAAIPQSQIKVTDVPKGIKHSTSWSLPLNFPG
jgi:amidase